METPPEPDSDRDDEIRADALPDADEVDEDEEALASAEASWPAYFTNRAQNASTNDVSLNRRYTFDTFVIGSSNRFAHAATLRSPKPPARAYNPPSSSGVSPASARPISFMPPATTRSASFPACG